jgi:hypothetical protein
MGEECANPLTGQPYDALTEREYAAIRRRQPTVLPCDCHDCGTRIDDGWWRWRHGKLELCCHDCSRKDDGDGPYRLGEHEVTVPVP